MENTEKKIYKLGNGNEFITDNPRTIDAITACEADLLEKASLNEDPKFSKYYERVKTDTEYRNKKVVSYVLKHRLDEERKKKDEKKS